nr:NADH dehydrogenase subunit 6 [Osculotes curta]
MMLGLFLIFCWWWWKSPSMSIIFLLSASSIWSLYVAMFLENKTMVYMFFLTLVGGLFVLTSLVVLTFPKDWKFSYISFFYSAVPIMFFFLSSGKTELSLSLSLIQFNEYLFLSVFFALFLLILALFIIDWFMTEMMKKSGMFP